MENVIDFFLIELINVKFIMLKFFKDELKILVRYNRGIYVEKSLIIMLL